MHIRGVNGDADGCTRFAWRDVSFPIEKVPDENWRRSAGGPQDRGPRPRSTWIEAQDLCTTRRGAAMSYGAVIACLMKSTSLSAVDLRSRNSLMYPPDPVTVLMSAPC